MSTAGVLVAFLAPTCAALTAASVLGGAKWLRAVNAAVGRLTDVAETLTGVTDRVAQIDHRLTETSRQCDERWSRLGGLIPHPRWAAADDLSPS